MDRGLEKADAAHLIKLDKVRTGTTVVPANVCYSTNSGLLSKGVVKLAGSAAALKTLRLGRRTSFRDRTRSVRRRAHSIGAWLRRRSDEAHSEVLKITGEISGIAARFGRVPRAVTADRGCGKASIELELGLLGVKTVAIRARRGLVRAAKRPSAPGPFEASSSGAPAQKAGASR